MKKLTKLVSNHPKKIEDAFIEIKNSIENGDIKDFREKEYSNYKLLFGSKEMQDKVFIHGVSGSLDVP